MRTNQFRDYVASDARKVKFIFLRGEKSRISFPRVISQAFEIEATSAGGVVLRAVSIRIEGT